MRMAMNIWRFICGLSLGILLLYPQLAFCQDEIYIVKRNGSLGIVDHSGKSLTQFVYDEVYAYSAEEVHEKNHFPDGACLIRVKKKGMYGYVDRKGNVVVPLEYDDGQVEVEKGEMDWIIVKKKGKWGVITRKNRERIHFVYDRICGYTSEGESPLINRILVKKDGKWGCIDTLGNEVIKCKYNEMQGFFDGLAGVRNSAGKLGIIDRYGKQIIPFVYDSLWSIDGDYIVVKKDGQLGVIDRSNNIVFPFGECWGLFVSSGEIVVYPQKPTREKNTEITYDRNGRRWEWAEKERLFEGYCKYIKGKKSYKKDYEKYKENDAYFKEYNKKLYLKAIWYDSPEVVSSADYSFGTAITANKLIENVVFRINGVVKYGMVTTDYTCCFIKGNIELKSGENQLEISVYEKDGQVEKVTRKIVYKEASKPLIYWLTEPQIVGENVNFKIAVKSGSKVSVKIFLNGTLSRAAGVIEDDGYDYSRKFLLSGLVNGDNTIRVEASNNAGTTISKRIVKYTNIGTETGNKLALVIGNQNYQYDELYTPIADADAVARKLQGLGFTVVKRTNLNKTQMESEVEQFAKRAKNSEIALFYYAGHGRDYDYNAYMQPLGASIVKPSDVKIQCVGVNYVIDMLEESRCRIKMVLVDACRTVVRGESNTDVELYNFNTPVGTFISYSTSPGKGAIDGSNHSPYCKAFLELLDVKGLSHSVFFSRIMQKVYEETNKSQKPRNIDGIMNGEFFFNPR